MKSTLEDINKTFKNKKIILKEPLDDSKQYITPDGITNQFLMTEDLKGNKYLIRINGKLWPPFTRKNEHHNLNRLKEYNINTNVMINNYKCGFQICYLNNESSRFRELITNKRLHVIYKIGSKINKIHKIDNFKNHYPIVNTIDNSLKRISPTEQNKLVTYHKILLSMFSTLNFDKENVVSFHNDLLPSSVYINEKSISFVDWEYSAVNHRSYDLALFSIKSSFLPEEEKQLFSAYDPKGQFDIKYSVTLMKPIINYLLLLWNLSSKQKQVSTTHLLLASLITNIQEAIYQQSARTLTASIRLSLFHHEEKREKNIFKEVTIKCSGLFAMR